MERNPSHRGRGVMRALSLAVACLFAWQSASWAFCGFYVATEDQPLVNKASRVVLVHKDGHTVVTMASDVHGDPRQFALVIPVPTVIQKSQVHIVRPETVEHLADYSKPRLVQYFDGNPCFQGVPYPVMAAATPAPAPIMRMARRGVVVEATFSAEEYDIVVLSATESGGLIAWLNAHGYHMPQDAAPVIGSYVRQHMHFFLAKVNLDRMKNNTSGFLRPIRVEYDTPKFMLPIRLGTVNASGPQDMIVLALAQRGRVDVTNYQTVRMPTGVNIPEYIQTKFGAFYDAAFARQVADAGGSAVFLEYAWPLAAGTMLCDPCSSSPMTSAEMNELGADDTAQPQMPFFLTRLHVRYDRAHFPEDLQFQETPDRENYQARFVTQVAWKGLTQPACAADNRYRQDLRDRWRRENATLAGLTGWAPADIRKDMVDYWLKTRQN